MPHHLGHAEGAHGSIPADVIAQLQRIKHYIVENEKTARAFIKLMAPEVQQRELYMDILDKRTDPLDVPYFLDPVFEGLDVGLISEAGVPCVADPGAQVVNIAHRKGVQVVPMVGPSSILMALMASGMQGQQFVFKGYLPHNSGERKKAVMQMERASDNGQTQIFMETPYRNNQLLGDLKTWLRPSTKLCVATDITQPTEFIKTLEIKDWARESIDLHKRPTIFIV